MFLGLYLPRFFMHPLSVFSLLLVGQWEQHHKNRLHSLAVLTSMSQMERQYIWKDTV